MYCSSCGVAVTPGLTYCNYCGEKLNSAKSDTTIKAREVRPESLIGAMVFSFVFGLGAITILIGVMKTVLRLELGIILAFTLLCFLVMLLLEGVFIRLLLSRKRGTEAAGDPVLSKGQATRELDGTQPRALQEPLSSVTEHTTRAFDRIHTERPSK
jgi:hypothetical protein